MERLLRSRLFSLIRKETRQLLRDKSNLAVGVMLPLILILLFGYGLSFDLNNVRIAVVIEQSSAQSDRIIARLEGSDYIIPSVYRDMPSAERDLKANKIDSILRIPVDFAGRLARGDGELQLILNGSSPNVANPIRGYVSGIIATEMQLGQDRGEHRAQGVRIEQRLWFNEASNSTWFLVPGLIVLILTLIGSFLTALLIARERERGTLESLFVTPVRPLELVLAKLAPYLILGAVDLIICLLAAHFLFEVPMRGSLWAIILSSMLYLVISLAIGLTISGFAKSQFLASQIAVITSFLPAMILSGFVFDTRNLPVVVQGISQIIPATHFMALLKSLFLAGGDDWSLLLTKSFIMVLYACFFIMLAHKSIKKRLG